MNDYSSSVKKKSADFSVRNVLHDRLNPLRPNISMHTLHTVLWTFPRVLTRKICLTILELFQKKKTSKKISTVHFSSVSLSAVQICDFHIFKVIYSSLHGFIWNQHKDQLPAGLLAQLVEQCTGIARVMGPNPVQADNIFQALFSQLLKYCSLPRRSLSYSRLYPQFTYVIFIYIYSHLSLSL